MPLERNLERDLCPSKRIGKGFVPFQGICALSRALEKDLCPSNVFGEGFGKGFLPLQGLWKGNCAPSKAFGKGFLPLQGLCALPRALEKNFCPSNGFGKEFVPIQGLWRGNCAPPGALERDLERDFCPSKGFGKGFVPLQGLCALPRALEKDFYPFQGLWRGICAPPRHLCSPKGGSSAGFRTRAPRPPLGRFWGAQGSPGDREGGKAAQGSLWIIPPTPGSLWIIPPAPGFPSLGLKSQREQGWELPTPIMDCFSFHREKQKQQKKPKNKTWMWPSAQALGPKGMEKVGKGKDPRKREGSKEKGRMRYSNKRSSRPWGSTGISWILLDSPGVRPGVPEGCSGVPPRGGSSATQTNTWTLFCVFFNPKIFLR
ncbi:uncharacterized protein LOC128947976 isoform X1 [Melozone crissalis]|uniref:uncharacterized protein LOC128947976 isoform X1 n=1 Tax=Melozone crissalis TaxID=40204 RepID=UPI0023DADCF6|nr:uncharacterized protein LOC128947976 isoform X1 [Melozone crissalis]